MFKNFLENLLLKLRVFLLTVVLFVVISIMLLIMVLFVLGSLPFAHVIHIYRHDGPYYELYMGDTKVAFIPTFKTFVNNLEKT